MCGPLVCVAAPFYARGTSQMPATYTELFLPLHISSPIIQAHFYRHHLVTILKSTVYTCGDNLEKQLKDLLITPLQQAASKHSLLQTCVLVIDALDECNFVGTRPETFIDMLLRHIEDLQAVRIKILISSRPIEAIISSFNANSSLEQHYRQNLHDEPLEAVQPEHDIALFVRAAHSKIRHVTFSE